MGRAGKGNAMKKKKKTQKQPQKPPHNKPAAGAATDIDKLLGWLSDLKTNCKHVITGRPQDAETDAKWQSHVAALEQATAIISALQDEGISDPEQVKDLIADYRAQAETHKKMFEKYETPTPMTDAGGRLFCPECRKRVNITANYCGTCGKRLQTAIAEKRTVIRQRGQGYGNN